MCEIQIINKKNEQKCKINISLANTFYKRLKGLMRKKKFNGLIFKQKYSNKFSGSIHTCFMKVPIDIVYVNNNMIIQEYVTLNPWKLYIPKNENIKYIIELPEQSVNNYNISIGDKIVINHEKKKT